MKKSKWTQSQIAMLVEKASRGNVRTHAFEEIARATGRRANSVRNYYYKFLAREKTHFCPFPESEVKQILREIVLGTSRGESVRSICIRLAQGSKSKMLRIQNKYRAIMRGNPNLIEKVKTELEAQGYLVTSPLQFTPLLEKGAARAQHFAEHLKSPNNVVTLPDRTDKGITDTDINNLFMGLMRLVKKQAEDGARGQIERLRAEVERLRADGDRDVK